MNTLVRIQGYVTDAHVLEPYAKHSYDIKRYELHLCPSDCTHFYDLEHRVEELKREYDKQQPYESQRHANHDKRPVLKDRYLLVLLSNSSLYTFQDWKVRSRLLLMITS